VNNDKILEKHREQIREHNRIMEKHAKKIKEHEQKLAEMFGKEFLSESNKVSQVEYETKYCPDYKVQSGDNFCLNCGRKLSKEKMNLDTHGNEKQ